jgi:hypothetical protein
MVYLADSLPSPELRRLKRTRLKLSERIEVLIS